MASDARPGRDPALWVFLAYPFADFAVRRLPLPGLAALWDEVVLAYLLWRLGRHGLPAASPLLRPLGVFLATAVAALIPGLQALGIGVEGMRAYFEYVLAFLVGRGLAATEAVAPALLVWVGAATAAAAHGVFQYATGAPMPAQWISLAETYRTRAYSVVGSPNGLGDWLAFALPVTAALAASLPKPRARAALAAAALVQLAGLAVTFSRGAWLALLAATAVAVLGRRSGAAPGPRVRAAVLALLPALLLAVLAAPPVRERLAVLVSPHYLERSLEPGGRLYRWNAAYEVMAHSPLTGAGPGQHGGAVAARRLGGVYTDNYYAKTAAELGLPGLAAFLWLMATCARRGRAAALAASNPLLAAGLWAGTMVVIFHNAVENIFEIPFLNAHFWFAMGILDAWAGSGGRTSSDG